MNKYFLAMGLGLLAFTGCKETDTPLDFSTGNYIDSTYVATTVPAADLHNVLVEEFSGQTCSNCPAGHVTLQTLEANNPGRVNVAGLYITGPAQTLPPAGSQHDFRDATATNIVSTVYGNISALPQAGIDRTQSAGNLVLGATSWDDVVNTQLSVTTPINLAVSSSFNTATNTATITTFVTYTQAVSSAQNLSIILVEDSIVDIQEYPAFNPTYPSGYDSSYVFTDVFRGMATAQPFGDVLLSTLTTKEAGRVDRRIYTYPLPVKSPAVNPAHCRVIAFVNSTNATGTDIHVIQSAQCRLIP